MSLIAKIKKHGLRGTLRLVPYKLSRLINNAIYYVFWILPIDDHLIVMESEGDLSDNAYALYDYMKGHGYLDRYKVVWLVDDVEVAQRNHWKNTEYVIKNPTNVQVKRARCLATCGYYIYDHCNLLSQLKNRQQREIVYLSHGCGYKAAKGAEGRVKTHYDHLTVTGPLAAESISRFWNEPVEKAILTGYPRIDYLYAKARVQEIKKLFNLEQYDKIFFWMPTFRQSVNPSLSEDYICNESGLPLLGDLRSLEEFSDFLRDMNAVVILKIHHLQMDLPIFSTQFSNVLILRDVDIKERNIQLYEFVSIADAMITDYSSIAIDYMVMNRPLVYILDDYEQYNQSRGLFPENAIDYMPGYHIYSVDELNAAITDICNGKDIHDDARKELVGQYHSHIDGNSSKRLVEFLNL